MKIKNLTTKKTLAAFLVLAVVAGGVSFAQAQTNTAKVTIVKYVDGSLATSSLAGSPSFAMNATWNATNQGGAGSGSYTLSTTGYNNASAYHATTAAMSLGSSYSTSEVKDGTLVGASCTSDVNHPKYALVGYSYGDTLAQAKAAAKTTVAPQLTNITSDKYVIVWNKTCSKKPGDKLSGTVTGTQGSDELKVNSIETIDGVATADGTFENGFKYTFNLTVPSNEQNLSMKFNDWVRAGGGGVIPAANNIRISSAQADNNGATVLITAANTYSQPTLHLTTDLDSSMAGRQVEVTVEVAVPSNTPNGNYSTSYGIKTL